jgi:hypothetical protein
MSQHDPPILPATPPSDSDKALVKLWSELEKEQLDILDQANKRIIELVTGLQALFLAILAFSNDFPPPYLKTGAAPYVALLVLALLTAALFSAVLGLQPRDYRKYEHNLTEMRAELERITNYKKKWYQNGIWLFTAGVIFLAVLIGMIILQNSA